jgi:methylglutaconyl-CoA hydratase
VSEVEVSLAGGVARVTINRPDKRNALSRSAIEALTTELERLAADPAARVVVLTGAGDVFSAGADLVEMRAQAQAPEQDNLAHARTLARLLGTLDALPKPTVARVNGDGYGGALGLIAACDMVVVADRARFAFTEVRLGIIPAVISPFVLARIGEHAARRYFLTADTLSANELQAIGLAHQVVARDALDATCERYVQSLLKGAPGALAEAKRLIRDMSPGAPTDRLAASEEAARRLARLRVAPEAQEGFNAFFEKRKPTWRTEN